MTYFELLTQQEQDDATQISDVNMRKICQRISLLSKPNVMQMYVLNSLRE